MIGEARHGWLRTAGALLLAGLLVAGCATPGQERVDPALFPREAASVERGVTTPIVLLADAALTDYVLVREKWDMAPSVQIGRILEAAAIAALSDVLGTPVERATDPRPAVAPGRAVPPPVLIALRPAGHEIPARSRTYGARLLLECQVLDAERSVLWSKRYDSGVVGLSVAQSNDSSQTADVQELRAVHRAAYAVMVEFAQDLRRWLEAERLRERVL
jgi:hypothetical protein